MKLSLYNITEEFYEIMSLVEQADGELTPEVEEALTINQEDLKEKCTNYFHFIRSIEGFIGNIDKEIERLNEIRAFRERGINKLKKNLLSALLIFGEENPKTKVKTLDFETFKLSTRRNPKVVITDELSIDTKYCDFSINCSKLTKDQQDYIKMVAEVDNKAGNPTIKTNYVISKTRIKEDIKKDIEVDGAYYDKDNFSLTIK